MRIILFLGFFWIFCAIQAQDRTPLNGVVLYLDASLENVHLKNVSTSKYALTNAQGEFSLNTRVGDTLLITHVSMIDVVKFITVGDVAQDPLVINMVNFSNELKEVRLNQYSNINAVSEGIISKKIPVLSTNERRLQTAGDFKFVHLLSILGGSLQIDPILNAINGRTKKLKRNISIEKQIEHISILEHGYHQFMSESMGLSEEEIQHLINFSIEAESLQNILNTKNEGRIQLFLIDRWNQYEALKE